MTMKDTCIKSKIKKLPACLSSVGKADNFLPSKKGRQTPTLSLCMIVKNEEQNLTRCLNSIKEVADEIIIVDTGSTDRTVDIARRFGAKIYYHAWEGSFSKARNYSLEYASCEWILILDADEELWKCDAPKLKELLKGNDCEAITLVVKNRSKNSTHEAYTNSLRLFRNFHGTYYKGSVHNIIVCKGRCFVSPLSIIHHGYNFSEGRMEEKFLRTTSMLREQIKKDPQNPIPYRFLGVAYLDRGRYEEAVNESKKALELAEVKKLNRKDFLVSYYIISAGNYEKGRLIEAESYALKAVELDNKFLDGFCVLSFVYDSLKRYDRFFQVTEHYLNLWNEIAKYPERFPSYTFHTMGHKWRIHLCRGFNYLIRKQEEEGNFELDRAIQESFGITPCLKLLGNFYLENNYLDKAEETFKRLLNAQEHSEEILFKFGLVKFKQRSFEEAIVYWRKAVEKEPALFDIRLMICKINIILEKFEEVVIDCNQLLKDLSLSRNVTLENFTDLAALFKAFGERLEEIDDLPAAKTAFKICEDLKRF